MKIVNLTKHDIVILPDNMPAIVIPPSGLEARVTVSQEVVAHVNGIPIVSTRYGNVTGLPEKLENDTVYIVSTQCLIAMKALGMDISQFVSPDTNPGSIVRDSTGAIIGVKRFQTI